MNEAGRTVGELRSLEIQTPITIVDDTTLRAKVIDNCGLACTFCHNEGTPVAVSGQFLPFPTKGNRVSIFVGSNGVDFMPGKMRADDDFKSAIEQCRDDLGLDEMHLTGGEPTLSPFLVDIAAASREAGYTVKLTSNGETGAKHIGALAAAGVEKINFSVFGTTPEELAETQHTRYRDPALAQKKITFLNEAVHASADFGIRVDMNLVVRGRQDFPRIERLIEAYGSVATIRLLNDLGAHDEAIDAIYEYLNGTGAQPVSRSVTAGSSSARTSFDIKGVKNRVQFKQIRDTRLPGSCDDCKFDSECEEGFYGVRLYVDKAGQYMVGVCIRRMDLTVPIDEFFASGTPQAIIDYRLNDRAELEARFAGLTI